MAEALNSPDACYKPLNEQIEEMLDYFEDFVWENGYVGEDAVLKHVREGVKKRLEAFAEMVEMSPLADEELVQQAVQEITRATKTLGRMTTYSQEMAGRIDKIVGEGGEPNIILRKVNGSNS